MSVAAPFNTTRGLGRAFRARPVALLVTLVAGLALVAGSAVVLTLRTQTTNEADHRLAAYATDEAATVDAVMTAAEQDIRLASRNDVFEVTLNEPGAALPRDQRHIVEAAIQYLGERYAVDEICLIRSDGAEVARYNGGALASPATLSPDESLNNPAFAPTLALAEDAVFRTTPYVSPDTGRWVFGLATPIVAPNGVGGILHFELPIVAFADALAARPFAETGYTFILAADGHLLAHPDLMALRAEQGLGADPKTSPFPSASLHGGESWHAAIASILGGTGGGGFREADTPYRFESRPILGGAAFAVSVSKESELYADATRAQLNLLVIVGPLAVMIVLLTGWFGRRLFTSNRRLADAMQASAELASIVASADDAITSVDHEGRILTWNDGAARMFGLAEAQAVGTQLIDLFPPEGRQEAGLHLASVAQGEVVDRFETIVRSSEGLSIDVSVTFSPVPASDGRVAGTSVIARDISARKALEEQLSHQALHDSLTGLPNRALFRDRLGHALARGAWSGTRPGSPHSGILFIDLDDFKVINDTLGHRIGDELLIEVGRRIQSAIRPGDTAARLGGDEFTVLLEDLGDTAEAGLVADRILAQLAVPFSLEGHEVVVGASIGIAIGDPSGAEADELLRSADTALYEAKASGKGRHATFRASMGQKAWHRLELEADLRRALLEDQLRVEYQPIVDLTTGLIVEVEALVLWHHPERGVVPPADFIPLAEQTGLIASIGEFVVETACRDLAAWRARRPDQATLGVSVNLSPRELGRPDLVEMIAAVCASHGLPVSALRLEITEGLQVDDPASVARLTELRAAGARISIDDFGTGYSSLAYFRRLPIDGLKLDRVFISALGEAREETAIVTAAIAFAAALGVEVTAEGIETTEQLEALRTLGCQFGQGFLLSRPVGAEAMAAMPARLIPPVSEDGPGGVVAA
jgi:diguanylate cyclase (GGDEF)-like protein/PAS domain S-box-containing protein